MRNCVAAVEILYRTNAQKRMEQLLKTAGGAENVAAKLRRIWKLNPDAESQILTETSILHYVDNFPRNGVKGIKRKNV